MLTPFALKYRPKSLSEIVGQEVAVQTLTNSFKNSSWHHAYILEGNLGCGKTSVARIMAAMENCENGRTMEPCGECKNCKDIFSGKSLDVKELDAASNRSIDDIRDLKKEAQFAPMACRIKYFILDESHSLTGKAAEAALKFIEEPPNNVRILLCTTDPQMLKDTIHSRCITLNFEKVSWLDLNGHILNISKQESIDIDEDAAKVISKTAKGSVRNALQNLQTVLSFTGGDHISSEIVQKVLGSIDEAEFYELIKNIVEINVASSVLTLDRLMVKGKNPDNIIKGVNVNEFASVHDVSILLLMIAPYFSYLCFGALFLLFSLYFSVKEKSYAKITRV